MCGRYATARKRQDLLDTFGIGLDGTDDLLEDDYNVAPTKQVPVVLERRSKPAPQEPAAERGGSAGSSPQERSAAERGGSGGSSPQEQVVRQLRALRWGLVPSWAKDLSVGARMINARVETVHEKPAFRRAFAKRRCLLPADGFFEWYTVEEDQGKKRPRKQPFFIRPKDGGIMAMAGLYEFWRNPEDEWVTTCTVITTAAPDDLGRIHERMPMVVEPELWDAWLDPARTDPDEVRELLVPAMAGTMAAYPVSTLVNNVRNNGPELIQPLPDGDASGKASETLF